MVTRRCLLQTLCAVAVALPLSGCVAKRRSSDAAPPTPLRVGVIASYPPLSFEEGGEIKGVEPDLARLVGRELGRTVELEVFGFEDLIPALNTRRIDVIMAGMSITSARERQVQFTKPYLRVGQMALIRRSDQQHATDYARMNLSTSRVGVQRGTTGDAYARASLPRARVVSFDSVAKGKVALRNGEIDYFIHDAPTIWRTTGRFDDDPDLIGMNRPLTAELIAWAVRPADGRTLGRELDVALERLEASGELESVLDRWLPVRRVTVG
jgi:ABC-type amino acid transport substrate-binding protein